MMSTSRARTVMALLLTGILASATPPPGAGEVPASDTDFLARHLTLVRQARDNTLVQSATPLPILEGIRKIVALRREAMAELDKEHPLNTLDGIETLDDYDSGAVLALHDLTSAFLAADSTPPRTEQLEQFNAVLGGIPSLGETPVAFMVFGITDMALMVTDTLWSAPEVSRPELAKTAISLIHVAANRYSESLSRNTIVDPEFVRKSGRFRTNSVIMRMRCPKDDSVYRIVDIRNRAAENGNILATYYIQCQVCDEPRVVEFVQEFQSRLNKMADRQRGQEAQEPSKPGKGVDP